MYISLAITSALLSAAFWAMASIAIGRLLASGVVSPAAATLFKNSAAAFTFLLCALIFGGHWPVGDAWAWLLVSGFLGFTVSDTLYFAAFQRCGVQTAATVMLLNVPIATVLALPLAGDEISGGTVPFMVVVLVGVVLVILDARVAKPDRSGEGGGAAASGSYWLGILLAVVAAFAIGTAVPLGRGGFDGVGVFIGAFIRLAGGALGAIPIALLSGLRRGATPGGEMSRLIEPVFAAPGPGSVWGRASVLGVGCAVVGLFPYHYAQRELPSGIATTLFATTPLFTLPILVMLGSRVSWKGWLGTLVGFLGVFGLMKEVSNASKSARPALDQVPVVQLSAPSTSLHRQEARKPSFVISPPPLRAESVVEAKDPDDHSVSEFVAVTQRVASAWGAEDEGGSLAWTPMLFDGRSAPIPRPRVLLFDGAPTPVARGHWADAPFACRLASGGLLTGTSLEIEGEAERSFQETDNTQFVYGLRLALEIEGPPALDLGWAHKDESHVLHGFGKAVPLKTGGADVIWVDDRADDLEGSMALYQRSVDALGGLGEETLVDSSVCDCCPPDVIELEDGTLVVAYRHRSEQDVRDIFFSRRDPRDPSSPRDGMWSAPTPVHADEWALSICPTDGPALATAGEVLAVAWFTKVGDPLEPEVRVAFSRDSGRTFSKPLSVVVGKTNGQVAIVATKATDDDERFLLVHLATNEEDEGAGLNSSWRAGLVRPDGAISPFETIAHVDGRGANGRLELGRAGPGVCEAVWRGPKGLESAEITLGALPATASGRAGSPSGSPSSTAAGESSGETPGDPTKGADSR